MTSLNQLLVSATSAGLTTSSTAYTDGDQVGTILSWDMGTNTYGLILAAQLIDASDIIGAYDLFLFDRSVTLASDNAVGGPGVSDADALFSLGVINFPFPSDMGGVRMSDIDSISKPVRANANGLIYGALVTRSGHTFFGATTALQVNLHFSLDV